MNTALVASRASRGKVASAFGYILAAPSLLFVIMALAEPSAAGAFEALVVFLLLLALGVFLIWRGVHTKRIVGRCRQYAALISDRRTIPLDSIAASMRLPVPFIIADLQKMIALGFFTGTVIDLATHELRVGASPAPPSFMPAPPFTPAAPYMPVRPAAPPQNEPFTCAGCGASGTRIQGVPSSCAYCGRDY